MINLQAQKQIDDLTVKKNSADDGLKDSKAYKSILLFPHTSMLLIIRNCKLRAMCAIS